MSWRIDNHPVELYFNALHDKYLRHPIEETFGAGQSSVVFAPVRYTLDQTPGRRFRSAIPLLLGDFSSTAIALGIFTELQAAAMTMADDVADDAMTRYGAPAAWQIHSIPEILQSLQAVGQLQLYVLRHRELTAAVAESLRQASLATSAAQLAHLRTDYDHLTAEDYLVNAFERVSVLGAAWAAAATGPNSAAVAEGFTHCARAGQIKNDLYDVWSALGRATCDDIAHRVATYPTLVFRDVASPRDRSAFFSRLWGQPLASDRDKYISEVNDLFTQNNVFPACVDAIAEETAAALMCFSRLTVPTVTHAILRGWLNLQFESGLSFTVTDWNGGDLSGMRLPGLT